VINNNTKNVTYLYKFPLRKVGEPPGRWGTKGGCKIYITLNEDSSLLSD